MAHWKATDAPHSSLGMVTLEGTAESGLRVNLRSNEGGLDIELYEGEAEDGGLEDRVRIQFKRVPVLRPLPGKIGSRGQEFELYDGPLSECLFEDIRTNTQEVEQ